MKRTRILLLAISAMLSSCALAPAQSRTNTIFRPCPNTTTKAVVEVQSDGDVNLVPCSGKEILFNGVATSNTITFTGSSRTNFFPYFTTNTNLGKSPFSWDGTNYLFSNAAATATFRAFFRPSAAGSGLVRLGQETGGSNNYFELSESGNSASLAANTITLGDIDGLGTATKVTIATGTEIISVNGKNVNIGKDSPIVKLGAWDGNGNGLLATFDDTTQQIDLQTSNTTTDGLIRITNGNSITLTSPNLDMSGSGRYTINSTITAGGTTGNQTINTPAGTVNFAAGTGTAGLTVTSNITNTGSLIFAVARTNDATCSVKNAVPANGSFVIRMTANCTAETSVAFWVVNQ